MADVYQVIRGIMTSILRLDKDGPQLKNNAGTIEARDLTDAVFTNISVADPTVDDNAVTKRYTDAAIPVATVVQTIRAAAPAGWLLMNADTIGNAASGATHAGAQYETLFDIAKLLAPNTGAEVFAAGNQVTLADMRQRFALGKANAGTGAVLGSTGGTVDHTHTVANHTHTETAHVHTLSAHTHTLGAHVHDMASHRHRIPHGGTNPSRILDGGGGADPRFTNFALPTSAPHTFNTVAFTGPSTVNNYALTDISDSNTSGASAGNTSGPSAANTGSASGINTGGTAPGTDAQNPPFLALNFIIKY